MGSLASIWSIHGILTQYETVKEILSSVPRHQDHGHRTDHRDQSGNTRVQNIRPILSRQSIVWSPGLFHRRRDSCCCFPFFFGHPCDGRDKEAGRKLVKVDHAIHRSIGCLLRDDVWERYWMKYSVLFWHKTSIVDRWNGYTSILPLPIISKTSSAGVIIPLYVVFLTRTDASFCDRSRENACAVLCSRERMNEENYLFENSEGLRRVRRFKSRQSMVARNSFFGFLRISVPCCTRFHALFSIDFSFMNVYLSTCAVFPMSMLYIGLRHRNSYYIYWN